MKPKNMIVWILLLGIVVLLMSTSVQAKELTEVNATDILKQIENGENISLNEYRITGELDLSEIKLKTIPNTRSEWDIGLSDLEEELKVVESKIEIRDSVFEDDVDFSNTQFRKDIDFYRTIFLGEIDFKGAVFSGNASFVDADFSDYAYFRDANFARDANFRDADFSDYTNFMDANFARDANFRDANFSYADFTDADFSDYANFRDADFSDYANFRDANFAGNANFEDANFARDANFRDANFAHWADFWDADFTGYADFNDANFARDATFFSTEFDKVSFTGTTFTEVCLIETDFNQMNVEWSTLKDALVFDGKTYKKLKKNFEEMGQFDDADAAYYQYRQLSQANKKLSFSQLTDVITGFSCGYGVKPWKAAALAVVIILIFIPIYGLRGGIRRSKENDEKDEEDVSSRRKTWNAFVDAFYFSMVTFTTIGYGDLYPADRYRKVAVMIEGLFGWLILALFIVSFANVMIRL